MWAHTECARPELDNYICDFYKRNVVFISISKTINYNICHFFSNYLKSKHLCCLCFSYFSKIFFYCS